LHRGPTIQPKLSLVASGIYHKSTSLRRDGRLFHSPGPAAANALSLKVPASQRMFGSLWNVVVAHEHQRQDG